MRTIGDIYDALNRIAPFSAQQSYDNSGLLVGDRETAVDRILVALDCSSSVVSEAIMQRCPLIVSHHPVIFQPLRNLPRAHPVYTMVRHDISCIATHTCLDIAPQGVNATLLDLLRTPLSLTSQIAVLDDGAGFVYASEQVHHPENLGRQLRTVLQCPTVRFAPGFRSIQKIGFACGSGGSLLEDAIAAGCDAFITGDVKHDRWYYAQSNGVSLFDCGHYALEQPVIPRLRQLLAEAFPDVTVLQAEEAEPICYID